MRRDRRWKWAAVAGVGAVCTLGGTLALAAPTHHTHRVHAPEATTATPIKHVVVIFGENVSFDHYFGTYRRTNNLAGTPGLGGQGTLLTNNPNRDASGNQVNPRLLDPANINDVLLCDQSHNYNSEQKAFDGGLMNKFVTTVGTASGTSPTGQPCKASDVMNYYDGRTVTGLWNYAQHFAMSDNFFGTTFGPSSPGAINLVSGNTGGVGLQINGASTDGDTVSDGHGGTSLIEDAQPYYDDCSTRDAVSMTGTNIGNELNTAGLSWGWFQGGFRPTTSFATATGGTQPTSTFTPDEFKGKFATPPASDQGLCNAVHPIGAVIGGTGGTIAGPTNYGNKDDYIPHHEPFNYYASTANPHHLPPASLAAIGTDTQGYTGSTPQFNTANHEYDISDFNSLVGAINHGYLSPDHLPALSFLKAPGYQDGHAAYSDPYDEQQFVTSEINALEHSPDWSSTAVIVTYDDSDGFYDHVYSGVHNPSDTSNVANPPGPQDFLTGAGLCGPKDGPRLADQNGRCGYGPRLPFLLISPWARHNHVSHTLTDFSSVLKFVEDNWGLPRIPGSFDSSAGSLNGMFDFDHSGEARSTLFLDSTTGEPTRGGFGPGGGY
ncbi:MAG: alkaline phosphatase family protein [Actinomycetota bacterium]|nr:alkaline phosphatase family protein [Actinomycetota bacterium]